MGKYDTNGNGIFSAVEVRAIVDDLARQQATVRPPIGASALQHECRGVSLRARGTRETPLLYAQVRKLWKLVGLLVLAIVVAFGGILGTAVLANEVTKESKVDR